MTSQEHISDRESSEKLFRELDEYPWASDDEFQSGLQAILGSSESEQDRETLTLQARCFYYSRKFGSPVDPTAYLEWRNAQPQESRTSIGDIPDPKERSEMLETSSEATAQEKPPYPLSFNHLVELITEGKEIPGIQEIPDTLLEGQASQSTSTQRKKPWEK